jgi:hypothetical protein
MKAQRITRSDRVPRHEHRVRAFSRDYPLITGLGDGYAVDAETARVLVARVADGFGVPVPEVVSHAGRRPDTGQCWAPRGRAVASNGAQQVAVWEQRHNRSYPKTGMIRIGTTTTLRTLAHELGHHLVHCLEPMSTPSHGKVWVARFDDAMGSIASFLATDRAPASEGY